MKKIENIKTFLEIEELSKLEQGGVYGGIKGGKRITRETDTPPEEDFIDTKGA